MDVTVREFGALGDGKANDTEAFMRAIQHCSEAGGGRVIVEEGCYRLGMLPLASHIELHLEKGAHLLASDCLTDFDMGHEHCMKLVSTPTFDDCDYDGKPTKFFLYAYQCQNVSITGEGVIDGNEEIFYGKQTKWHIDGFFYPRMPLIFFEDCEHVLIEGVKLTKSAFWTTHLVGCRDVLIQHISIENNLRLANCDGIDPDHCQHVTIRDCQIAAADDCIVFKTTAHAKKYGPCAHILVEDCTLISTSAAIKFGTESVSDFEDIHIKNCRIRSSNRGICLQLRDEGTISNVSFEHLSIETRRFSPEYWWGKAEPIILTAVRRNSDIKVGAIHHISFSDICMNAENGIFIYGTNQNISHIQFQQIRLTLENKTAWSKNTYDLRPSEKGILENLNYPLYLHSCQHITFTDYQQALEGEMQHLILNEIYLYDVSNVQINAAYLQQHLEKLHTTKLGLERIYQNTGLEDGVAFLKNEIQAGNVSVLLKGKNFYASVGEYVFTIHHKSFTIITAYRRKYKCNS